MTKLLEEAVQKLSQLPKGRQDELARMLIDVAASVHPYQFTAEERVDIEEAMAQAEANLCLRVALALLLGPY